MAKGVKLFMKLFKTSKAILSLARVIYSTRKSTSMNQTFTNQWKRKREKERCIEGSSARPRGSRDL